MRPKILVVDDDKNFVEMLRVRLEVSGYDVVCAFEGVRAIEKAHSEKPALILLDWSMPAGKGGAVLGSLAEKDDTRHIPVIIITGMDITTIEKEAKKYRVKAIFSKPYDPHQLIQKIHEVLEWSRL